MNLDKFTLNRRNFLRGAGLALALPWLETFAEDGPKIKSAPKRFFSVYHPDGIGMPLKTDPAYADWSWFPTGSEKDFKLSKVLDVLEPLRSEITIYSGLSHPAVRSIHGHSNADQYLTGAPTGGQGGSTGDDGPYKNSISLDQLYAAQVGEFTRHSSLVMSTNGGTGAPRGTLTSSFNAQGRPIPAMNKPKQIFDMLFVAQKDTREKLARSKSALDLLMANTRSLEKQLSQHDQQTLAQYLDSVRDTEIKIAKAEKWIKTPPPNIDPEHLKKMDVDPNEARLYLQAIYELTYLAFLSDSTRVATYMMGRENGEGIHDNLAKAVGFNGAHDLTHQVKKPGGWKNLGTYNRFQAEEFGRFVKKLKDTREPNGNGTMLDNTFAMHGSASSSFHLSRNYPIISAGGKNLGFTNGRYLKFGKGNEDNQAGAGIDTDSGWQSKVAVEELPLAHLFVTILQRLGVETEEFAGYKGGLQGV